VYYVSYTDDGVNVACLYQDIPGDEWNVAFGIGWTKNTNNAALQANIADGNSWAFPDYRYDFTMATAINCASFIASETALGSFFGDYGIYYIVVTPN
jgi:hypothetical protein